MILTITPNPSLDLSTAVSKVEPTKKLRCQAPDFDAGGGGINVARVLQRLGLEAEALAVLGGSSGKDVEALLRKEGLSLTVLEIAGRTRQNVTLNEIDTKKQYRLVMPGPDLSGGERDALLARVRERAPSASCVVASGSLPGGAAGSLFRDIGEICREREKDYAVDTSGIALRDALRAKPWLIKPNREELEALLNVGSLSIGEACAAAQRLVEEGSVKFVLLSLGQDGALLACREGCWRAEPLKVEPVSAIGAGDSMLAAFLAASARGLSPAERLAYGVAAGTAALLTPGTDLCRPEDVERLYKQVRPQAM